MTRGRRRTSSVDTVRIVEEARENERADIARELHDTVIQPLAALVTGFENYALNPPPPGVTEAYIAAWRELTQEAIAALRCALGGLRAHPHAEVGLPEALHRYLVPQARAQGIRLLLESRDWASDLPLDWTSSLYLLVREAMTNVQKHARASEVTILLRADETQISIIIADNGVGFHVESVEREDFVVTPERRSGFGIMGMRERVSLLGGCLDLVSDPGQGTRIEVCVPRPPREQEEPDDASHDDVRILDPSGDRAAREIGETDAAEYVH
jgi:signal transduction histidine kinase